MCIIIDTNSAGDYAQNKEYLKPIGQFITNGGRIVISRMLFEEYPTSFQKVIVELARVGKVVQCEPEHLPPEVARRMMSDDPHIVSLVRTSRARVVCTQDNALIEDLKNATIIRDPRCSVYKHEGARGVLNGCCP